MKSSRMSRTAAALLVLFVLARPTAAVAQTGLVAAYGFNEGAGTTVGDASINAISGSVSGATWTTSGRFGGALSFNGTSSLVTIPHRALLNLTSAMTLEAWVNSSS